MIAGFVDVGVVAWLVSDLFAFGLFDLAGVVPAAMGLVGGMLVLGLVRLGIWVLLLWALFLVVWSVSFLAGRGGGLTMSGLDIMVGVVLQW